MYAPDPVSHLPDPNTQPGFYESVPIKRLLAWVIDTGVVLALIIPVIVLTLGLSLFVLPMVWLIVSFLYRWATIASKSSTWGMRMMSIELRDAHGQRLDGGLAFIHTLGYSLSMAFFIVQVVSIVLMVGSPRGQGVTDMALGTVMLNRRA
ncbi:MAG: RDD family protein [Primorskyibacter sp.]